MSLAGFDGAIIAFCNRVAQHAYLLDKAALHLCKNNFLKGGAVMALVWWVWFKDRDPARGPREHVLATLCACLVALFLGRLIAFALPFRTRPLYDPRFVFPAVFVNSDAGLTWSRHWSSFPSDHAMLYFALSAGLLYVSRWAGIYAALHTLCVICLPRIFVGLHYPSDVIGGAIIGSAVACLANSPTWRRSIAAPALHWLQVHPGSFYAAFFILTYQIADLFYYILAIGEGTRRVVGPLLVSM